MRLIVYLNSSSWPGFPGWFRPRFERAIRAGSFGDDFKRGPILEADVYRAASRIGFRFDHIGRTGSLLTNEPYQGSFTSKGLAAWCEALNLNVEIKRSDYHPRTVLQIFKPKDDSK